MTDLDYIKNFSKITVSKICKKLKIDNSNVSRGTTSKENLHLVREHIENEIANLYRIEEK